MATYNIDLRRDLARGLKAARVRAKLGSAEAALELTKRGLNCQRGTLLAWERGYGTTSREPYASDLPVIAALYGCAVGELFSVETPLDAPRDDAPRPLYAAADGRFTPPVAAAAPPTRSGLHASGYATAESTAGLLHRH